MVRTTANCGTATAAPPQLQGAEHIASRRPVTQFLQQHQVLNVGLPDDNAASDRHLQPLLLHHLSRNCGFKSSQGGIVLGDQDDDDQVRRRRLDQLQQLARPSCLGHDKLSNNEVDA